ncbi:MAG: DUF1223 domain-containing protein [Pseudomonadota bacterium]
MKTQSIMSRGHARRAEKASHCTPAARRSAVLTRVRMGGAGIALALAGMVSAPGTAAADGVLVELFTSQGCSSCPPADRILGDVAEQPGVVALSFHVDYWDYLGWRDTFADARFSHRQYAYRDSWGARVVYTPQMVVGGDLPVQGNRAVEVEDAITVAKRAQSGGRIDLKGGSMVMAELDGLPNDAVIWMARYLQKAGVAIKRGENAGRTIEYHNVVQDFARLGTVGEAPGALLTLPSPGPGEGIAVWAQGGGGHGRVLAISAFEVATPGAGG